MHNLWRQNILIARRDKKEHKKFRWITQDITPGKLKNIKFEKINRIEALGAIGEVKNVSETKTLWSVIKNNKDVDSLEWQRDQN